MSTWEQDRERLRLAWTRFYVVAVYRPLRPIAERIVNRIQQVGEDGGAVSEDVIVKTLDCRTPSWGRSVDIRSKLPNGKYAGAFFGPHLGVGDLLILKSDGPTGAATYRVTAITDNPFDPGDVFYFEAEFNQRWPHD